MGSNKMMSLVCLLGITLMIMGVNGGNLGQDLDITWGYGRGKFVNNGQLIVLTLDNFTGSGFHSKNEYLYGRINMQIKLVPGNSAGTVTAYYLRSQGDAFNEIDYEFLGNVTGQPYTVHTNVYTGGKGDREQQFHLWFDPTTDFHTYSILWNPQTIIFAIDDIPIREYKNREALGIPFPKLKPMRLHSSLWNADQWATQGGRIKTDWTQAPFSASYRNFRADACVKVAGRLSCPPRTATWMAGSINGLRYGRLRWVRKNFMIYNYCTDTKRFPHGFPKECHFQV